MQPQYVVDLPPYRQFSERPSLGDLVSWNFENAYSSLANAGFLFLSGVVVGAYMFSGKRR